MVSIVEVTTKAQLRRFVEYPMELYKDVPQYIPGTYDDDLEDWDRKKNPAFEYCQARCWLAMRDGEIVGRIGAILSRKANEKWHTNRLRFTQVDFIDVSPRQLISVATGMLMLSGVASGLYLLRTRSQPSRTAAGGHDPADATRRGPFAAIQLQTGGYLP